MRLDRYYRNILNGKTSKLFLDVIGDSVTLLENVEKPINRKYRNVAFKEIEVVPFEEMLPNYYRELFKIKANSEYINLPKLVDKTWDYILKSIEKEWNVNKFHLVYHSSGFDSRIISLAIKALYEKHGKDWLGDVLFLCFEPEGNSFIEIMDYQGWDHLQYSVYKRGCKNSDYYIESFDYEKNPYHTNGIAKRILNTKSLPLKTLQDKNILPSSDKIQLFSGQVSGIFDGSKIKSFDQYYGDRYYSYVSRRWSAVDCEVVEPFMDFDLVKFVLESKMDNWNDRELIKSEIIKFIDPKMIDFERWSWKDVHALDFFRISDDAIKQCVSDYKNSYYFRKTGKKVKSSSKYGKMNKSESLWWLYWSLGSLSNVIVKNGCKIKLKG